MPTIRELVRRNLAKKQDVLHAIPGTLGDNSGVVAVPGRPNYVYVRVSGVAGEAIAEIFNNRVENSPNKHVWVGNDPIEPHLFQVLSARSITRPEEDNKTINAGAPNHHLQHEYPGGTDIVWVQLMQFMPFRVFATGGLTISVYRGVVYAGGAWRKLEESVSHDMSSYVPTTSGKACFVLVTLDSAAAVTFTKGSEVDLASLAMTDIPLPPAGASLVLAAIRIYNGQTAINESQTNLDIVDLRFPYYGEAQGLQHAAVTLAASADAILGLSGQQLSADSQTANKVLAGPATGAAAAPAFRSLVLADLPTHTLIMSVEDLENMIESGEAVGDVLQLTDWMEYPGGSESLYDSALLTVAGSSGSGGTAASLAYNKNFTDQWISMGGPHWTTFAFSRKRFVSKIVITANAGDWMVQDHPTHWHVYGSNTGAFAGEETLIVEGSAADLGIYTTTISAPRTGYRYYKITFPNNTNLRINEIQVYTMADEPKWVNKTLAGAGISEIGHAHSATDITSGTMAQARLGSGSGGAGDKFLADDQTYKVPAGGGDMMGDPAGVDGHLVLFDTDGYHTKDGGAPGATTPIYPEQAIVFGDQFNVVVGGSGGDMTAAQNSAYFYAMIWNQGGASQANGDAIETSVLLKAGTYNVIVRVNKNNNRPIVDWKLDGTNFIASQDWYNSSGLIASFTGTMTIATTGRHLIRCVVNGKNASSSGYVMGLTCIVFKLQTFTSET